MIARLTGAVLGAVLLAGLALASPAAAHVTVEPADAVRGGYAGVVFRVANERDNARTTKLEIQFPEANPVADVTTMPVPGWKVQRVTRKLDQPIDRYGEQVDTVVSRLIWTPTSTAYAIAPDTFMEFPVSLGPLPQSEALVFGALQTYSTGEVVRWTDQPATGGAEPEHPAPVLRLVVARADEIPTQPQARNAENPVTGGDGGATVPGAPLWLGVAGLVAGVAGLILGALAWWRSRPEPEYLVAPEPEPDDEPPSRVRRAAPG